MTDLVDHRGRPLRSEVLAREMAGPSMGSVRTPFAGYPADGLNPIRLAQILRAADMGSPLNYFELAEQIEERDLHYAGVLATRKRSVAQLDVTVEAASDSPHDIEIADFVRAWIDRDELADEMFDILDAVGKGISFTEIIWDFSEGQWWPKRLEWRDPRWFTFDRLDGRTPMLRGGENGAGGDTHLEPFKFICHQVKAKSGLPVRSGLARLASWTWMFKMFTQRDWAIFTQTYGQPIRIGKFQPGASDSDRATLFRAVANIAGDMAAIVPAGMAIDFVESKNVGPGSDLFEKRSDWLDRQVSKAVLGQTGTTDGKAGGLGDGGNKVHDGVREDIETADAKGGAATLNRDLIRPMVDLNYGPQRKYPRLRIGRPKQEDVAGMVSALGTLVPLGMRVQASEVRDKLGLSDPDEGAELLGQPAPTAQDRIDQPSLRLIQALQAASAGTRPAPFPADAIADRLSQDAAPEIADLLEQIEAMLEAANDPAEFREMLLTAFGDLPIGRLAAKIGDGLVAARAAGRFDVEGE